MGLSCFCGAAVFFENGEFPSEWDVLIKFFLLQEALDALDRGSGVCALPRWDGLCPSHTLTREGLPPLRTPLGKDDLVVGSQAVDRQGQFHRPLEGLRGDGGLLGRADGLWEVCGRSSHRKVRKIFLGELLKVTLENILSESSKVRVETFYQIIKSESGKNT